MGDENPIHSLGDYSRPSHEGYRNTIKLPNGNNVVPLRSDTIRLVQNGCKSIDFASNWLERLPTGSISTRKDLTTRFVAQFFPPGRNAKLQNDILIESWNDPRDFTKPVKAISFPQDISNTSDRCLIELKNQVQRLMEAHLAPKSPTQVNKIASSCEICSSTIGSDAAEDIGRDTIIEVDKKAEEGLDGSKIIIEEDEPRDIKQNKLDDKTCGETKEVDEVEMESEESAEEIEEEEEDDPKFFDTFPTIEELGYHEWLLKNP
ncbi:hypothetical protein Tco_1450307 [Tanacetum coccineum]